MDAEKVDSVVSWKMPTNRDLLRGFIGSMGYLTDDIPNDRIPMGVLSSITSDAVPFRWGFTEQCTFKEVKSLVQAARDHHHVPLDYSVGAPPIQMVTDRCATGISGVVSQGAEWRTARIAAFYSAKLNSAQQNYPVNEIEMLAGIETILQFANLPQGVEFRRLTDHKGLTHLLNQKNLSGRQARWLEKISAFNFKVVYIEGSKNVVADVLLRMYSGDAPGTLRSASEFPYHDVVNEDTTAVMAGGNVLPILAGIDARITTRRGSRVRCLTEKTVQSQGISPLDDPEERALGFSQPLASRMKDRLILRSPQKGGSSPNNIVNNDADASSNASSSKNDAS